MSMGLLLKVSFYFFLHFPLKENLNPCPKNINQTEPNFVGNHFQNGLSLNYSIVGHADLKIIRFQYMI